MVGPKFKVSQKDPTLTPFSGATSLTCSLLFQEMEASRTAVSLEDSRSTSSPEH